MNARNEYHIQCAIGLNDTMLSWPLIIDAQDVRTIGANFTSLVVTSHKGYVRNLLDNAHHKDELIRMVSHHINFVCV